ncbi:MAG: polysaccharide deacetylase family protein [Balneolaceae bacterium]|nr:polysaccharide deacetylase family protein [Balneolaceae bacterium]
MYHYIRPDDPEFPYFKHLHIDDFEKQLNYFAEEYGFISKQEFEESLKSASPNAKGIILTFDDGFKDHFSYVLPELEKRGLWGIFYIPASPFLEKKFLDVHRIHLLLGKHGGSVIADAVRDIICEDMLSHSHIEEFHSETYNKQSNNESTRYVKRLLNYFIDYRFRRKVIDELMTIYYPNEKELVEDFYMTKGELAELHHSGMVLGSHTVTHPVMSKLRADKQEREIALSFEFIESIAGKQNLKTFCYPYGGFHTFTAETEKLLEKYGCLFSFNVESRDIEHADLANRKQALPRYNCNEFPYGSCRNAY